MEKFSLNEYAAGAAHGVSTIHAFNFYTNKGYDVPLQANFATKAAYQRANRYAQSYMKKHNRKYPFAFDNGNHTTIYGHDYYWTVNGLRIQFQEYEVAPFAAGLPTLSIPAKYQK
ncbi:MAG: RsiV family protein [Sporolactobacillus sp.]